MQQLEFRPDDHSYWLGEKRLPGVTSILSCLGSYEGVPAEQLQIAAARGTRVHLATELEDRGEMDYASLDDETAGYFNGYLKFLDDYRPEILDIEVVGYHPTMLYAGTRDRRMVIKGKQAILDIKSSFRLMPATGPQTAAYREIYNAAIRLKKDQIRDRYGLRLTREGGYELKQYKDENDLNVFRSCLNVYRFKEQHTKLDLASMHLN